MKSAAVIVLSFLILAVLVARPLLYTSKPEQGERPSPPALSEKPKEEERVLLVFGADWCPHCFLLEEHLEKADKSGLLVQKVDADERPDLVKKHSVKVLPTSVILVDGKETSRITGFSRSEYETWMESNKH